MSSAIPSLPTDEWTDRITPHLAHSLERVSEEITQSKPVQAWLRRASAEAAEGLMESTRLNGQMRGYLQVIDDLQDALPSLVTAIEEVTDGCGRLDLDWRPMNPTYSRLFVNFDCDFAVHSFHCLSPCTADEARAILRDVGDQLPEGRPFPNRPNVVTGYVGREGVGLGVRVKEHAETDSSGQYRTVALLPPGADPVDNLSFDEARRRLLDLLC